MQYGFLNGRFITVEPHELQNPLEKKGVAMCLFKGPFGIAGLFGCDGLVNGACVCIIKP